MTPTEGMDTAVEPIESVDISTDAVEASIEGATEDTTKSTEAPPPPAGTPYRAVTEDGKRLDEKARATIEELRQKDPQLAKAFRDAIFDADRLRRALPGGIKEVQELRQTVENLGGAEGIQEAQEKLAGWDSFDNQYMAGDPKALEFMLSTPESQQAFLKLAPMAMNKFEELNPDGFASYVCQRIMGDALANRIPISMELAQHYLNAGDSTKASEELSKIVGWFQALDATAKKPASAPQPKGPTAQDDPRFKELEQRDTERTRDDWRQETAKEQNTLYSAELNRLLAGRKVTDAQREDILLRVQTKLGLRIKEHEKTLDKYFAVKDKDGFLKFSSSFSKKNIPELLREAVDRYVPSKPGPKATPPQNGRGPVVPPINGQVAPGFIRVQAPLKSDQIDWSNPFNTQQNIKSGKAIGLDGKKVSWR